MVTAYIVIEPADGQGDPQPFGEMQFVEVPRVGEVITFVAAGERIVADVSMVIHSPAHESKEASLQVAAVRRHDGLTH